MNNTAKAIFQIYCQAKIKESIRVKLFCRGNKNSIFFNAQSFFSQKNLMEMVKLPGVRQKDMDETHL